ncbi:hypothetical protein BJ878DRAFT_311035 [Calycina marina]|uniref:DUF1754-domain-containing protein n=1 Tax=Calycina marina TaxID=1763456 RepID=A0A9P7Z699_9HELO|nr:hypothetical protein BJ878DRAFT_311035 [Calycina marina]
MPSDDYASTVRGGLKLKGSSKPSGIRKQKKKATPASSTSDAKVEGLQKALAEEDASVLQGRKAPKGGKEKRELSDEQLCELETRGGDGKTASERAHEEMRRRRLQDRLAKEGVKTHKQRVEELNKYLSNLSEHHDMPRIGPG